MVEAAVADVEGLEASRLEIDAGGMSYTADTLRAPCRPRTQNADLFVVLGADAAAGLATWERSDEVCDLATIVVVERPGSEDAVPAPGWRWERVEVPERRGVQHRSPSPGRGRPSARLPRHPRGRRLHRGARACTARSRERPAEGAGTGGRHLGEPRRAGELEGLGLVLPDAGPGSEPPGGQTGGGRAAERGRQRRGRGRHQRRRSTRGRGGVAPAPSTAVPRRRRPPLVAPPATSRHEAASAPVVDRRRRSSPPADPLPRRHPCPRADPSDEAPASEIPAVACPSPPRLRRARGRARRWMAGFVAVLAVAVILGGALTVGGGANAS